MTKGFLLVLKLHYSRSEENLIHDFVVQQQQCRHTEMKVVSYFVLNPQSCSYSVATEDRREKLRECVNV